MPDAPQRPATSDLLALGPDDWSQLLATALPVVRQLPDLHTDAVVKRVASLPPGRLAAGRSRRDLAAVLTREAVWDRVVAALADDAPRPWEQEAPQPAADPDVTDPGQVMRLQQRVAHLEEREQTLVEKVTGLREDVASLRRERDGAVARADRAEAAEQTALAARDEARGDAQDARAEAAAADERVGREVERARRRDDGELARLREDLRDARRERDELRTQLSRARERAAAAPQSTPAPPPEPEPDDSGGRRGRPSQLPEGIAAGTRRAAEWLVAEGRVLLVDGYNVTRTHRPELPLPEQRRWLEQGVTALARRRHVDATIFWDSTRGRPTTRRSRGGVAVRFTPDGVTADDAMVLHVQMALDPDTPVVAVTDDVELRGRLAEHGVDLLDCQSFTWLL